MSFNLEVVLEPEKSCYVNGDDVTGWVNVKVETVTACRAILARARGFCEVTWESDDEMVTDTETFFDHTITVWSGASYGENLMPGEFRLPFCFKLPDKLPPTYEGKYGHVRYSVEAQNDFQWGAVAKGIARFKVKPIQDLNEDPKLVVEFSVGGYWDVDVENTFRVGTVPVGKLAFALDGDPTSNTQPSAPPLEGPITPPSPILEQPRALPAPSDPLLKEGKEGDGRNLPVS
ncbi:Arrestin domain-containing protein 1 [Portunus trituberculatus]|uniref:Arrestin domain-containing protein 1 n=1 Tax=Portunus trituberculatus TaxID=210409 RepID=A0A5B7CDP1_PORTR|nr:Arrestin domain-containing protein 1 [Portunus trituberculatus]